MNYYQVALRTAQSERDSHGVMPLSASAGNFNWNANARRIDFDARGGLESIRHCDHEFFDRRDTRNDAKRIREHRAPANFDKRLGLAPPKPDPAARRNNNRRRVHFFAPPLATKSAIAPTTA